MNAICLSGEDCTEGVKSDGAGNLYDARHVERKRAQRLANAGHSYYSHNLDLAGVFTAISSLPRTYQERLDTLEKSVKQEVKVCSGGIVGLGETVTDRAGLLLQLANLPTPPEACQSTCW